MSVLCVREHSEIVVSDRFSIDPESPTISPRHLTWLDRISRRMVERGGARPFDLGFRTARTRHYCGVVCLGKEAIEVLPKIESTESDQAARGRFLRMLAFSRKVPIREAEAARLAQQGHTLLDVLLKIYCTSALELVRRGLLHRYEAQEANLPLIRGRLKFAVHVTVNHGRRDRAYCAYDEFSPDNTVNRMIRAAAEYTFNSAHAADIKALAREVINCLDEISDRPVSIGDYQAIPRDRSTQECRRVLDLAALILFGPYPAVGSGDTSNPAFLFDMNRLFETYVGRHAAVLGESLGWTVSIQGPRKWLGYAQDVSNDPCFQLRPDVVVARGDATLAIIDTKWKVLAEADPIGSVSEGDIYQMLAYLTRYQSARGCLLYPLPSGAGTSRILKRIRVSDKRILLAGLQLDDLRRVPEDLTRMMREIVAIDIVK
jgi:5-methylcytosine-specific restriction enzyme subunit McrC